MNLTAVFVEVEGGIMAWIEEMEGVATQGATLAEARENLLDALAETLEARRELARRKQQGNAILSREALPFGGLNAAA
ncbi:type II toxin-antitoxin system HicB family antitoxin [Candidatus Oscillochloris fontis]|uniref:type II toxin-antitoxin system HicB family antitoxin n=1 Tax=Candidatus Oscillochloris fontis TaxID=2496868 RepID=UPI0015844057|nr:type II toxin-antitoxin system HicB family antitoxin [Candidatus Oscillochloris fontis]